MIQQELEAIGGFQFIRKGQLQLLLLPSGGEHPRLSIIPHISADSDCVSVYVDIKTGIINYHSACGLDPPGERAPMCVENAVDPKSRIGVLVVPDPEIDRGDPGGGLYEAAHPPDLRLVSVMIENVSAQGDQIGRLLRDLVQQPLIVLSKLPPVQVAEKDDSERSRDLFRVV